MASMTRSEARETVFCLIFETEFHREQDPQEIYELAAEVREFEQVCKKQEHYIREVYFGVQEKMNELDERISKHSNGWRPDRIAPVSRSILRLAIFEMLYLADVPETVALNEAIELAKKFDEDKAKALINGILHAIKTEIEKERAEE